MPSDSECMHRAFGQARLSRCEPGRISPKVGAVVVDKNGKFLAEAHRGEDQDHKDHAEFYALERILGSKTLANGTVCIEIQRIHNLILTFRGITVYGKLGLIWING